MGKVGKVYYSISEVAELTGLEAHVLRYWETEFPSLKPHKNRGGNRAYREKDIKLLFLIKKLLYHDRFTIEGARRQIVKASDAYLEQLELGLEEVEAFDLIRSVREELREIAGMIDELPGDVARPTGKGRTADGTRSSGKAGGGRATG
jgi:DNA-binding transcriptional MerR regulator